MDSGYYAAMTGLLARTQALDTAAANLANAGTPGYRAEREYFRSVMLDQAGSQSQLGQTVNNYGLLGGDRLSMRQGPLEPTGNPLDLAIDGQGFFAVQAQNGIRYTRDGSFHRSQAGTLVTAVDEPVLSEAGKPIPVPPGEVSVGADGVLSVAGGTAAKVGVFAFAPGVELTAEGANRYVAPADAKPAAAANAEVHQGALESANENAVEGTLDLIVMQRQAEMMQKALTVFHTEFNKFASEDLARV
ncbi:MAG TPA: flagellar hook basal-body protein [Terracidiphilus sp.]|jgi:flagellar basal-body rod protein FlgF/flagellar basal-body rod protein FlgG|nr:flagellar hook basal-body protein [Terracidiphilus sp.]